MRRFPGWVVVAMFGLGLLVCQYPSVAQGPVTPIHGIQYTTDPSGISPYSGETVTTTGVVASLYPHGYVIQESDGGPWSGIYVYDADHAPTEGDEICLTGTVTEYYGLTEIQEVTWYTVTRVAQPLPPVEIINGDLISDGSTGEAYEGVLVGVGPVAVTNPDAGYGEWEVEDASGATIRVGDRSDYSYMPVPEGLLDFVRGTLFHHYGNYVIEPRYQSDIRASTQVSYTLRGTIVTPDTVIHVGYVTVRDDRITRVSHSPPATGRIIDTNGLVFPGLIDAHNHPSFNVFGQLSFGRTFLNRYQWQSSPTYWAFRSRYEALVDRDLDAEMWKYAELRALIAGTTSIQGAAPLGGWDAWAHVKILIRNVERWPSRIFTHVKPLSMTEGEVASLRSDLDNGVYQAVLIHLSEGIDQASLDEFYAWRECGLLDESTVIIHGIPYGDAEYAAMAAGGASLVWSPQSNLTLYGQTADIPRALRHGVSVSLAPDWCPTGSYNILDELKVADRLNRQMYGGLLSDQDLVRMVTTIPAQQLRLDDRIGRIEEGLDADLTVIQGNPDSAYRALIEAKPSSISLVIVRGRPMYGDAALMAALGAGGEPITICGSRDRIVAVGANAPGIEESGQTLEEIRGLLYKADPGILPLDPCSGYHSYLPILTGRPPKGLLVLPSRAGALNQAPSLGVGTTG